MLMIFCKQSGILHGIKMLTIYKNLEFFKPSNMDYRLYIYVYVYITYLQPVAVIRMELIGIHWGRLEHKEMCMRSVYVMNLHCWCIQFHICLERHCIRDTAGSAESSYTTHHKYCTWWKELSCITSIYSSYFIRTEVHIWSIVVRWLTLLWAFSLHLAHKTVCYDRFYVFLKQFMKFCNWNRL